MFKIISHQYKGGVQMNDRQIYEQMIALLDEAKKLAKEIKEGSSILLMKAEAMELKKGGR